MRNETSVGSSHTHQWPHDAFAQIDPVIIGAARATAPIFGVAGAGALPGRWLAVLALYDLIFALMAWALFDYLVED